MKTFMLSKIAFLVAFGMLATACKHDPATSEDKTVIFGSEYLWKNKNILVCWESKSSSIRAWKQKVKDHVRKNVNKTGLNLMGWGSCHDLAQKPDIRIFVYDGPETDGRGPTQNLKKKINGGFLAAAGQPRVRWWGSMLHNQPAGLILTFKFSDVRPELKEMADGYTERGKENLILAISLHEMGHAIGLRHEDAHPEKTCTDFDESLGTGKVVTSYNYNSVMSRCFYRNVDYNIQTINFNEQDIEGIRKAYKSVLHLEGNEE